MFYYLLSLNVMFYKKKIEKTEILDLISIDSQYRLHILS